MMITAPTLATLAADQYSLASNVSTPPPTAPPPNLVYFLTDDQDLLLGGTTPMRKTKEWMVAGGLEATNFFVHVPICCPSRASMVSGKYFHNIKVMPRTSPQIPPGLDLDGKHNSTVLPMGYSPNCMHIDLNLVNNNTLATGLAAAGYAVGLFGKYLNNVPNYVPAGFSAWMANGGGNYIDPTFHTHGLGFAGIHDGIWQAEGGYTTAVVGNVSAKFLDHVVKVQQRPFVAFIWPKAAHEPFIPAPWYLDTWDPSWPDVEPRTPNWNCSAASRKGHHGNIATQPMIDDAAATVITGVFKNRWRALLSVDDVVDATIKQTQALGVESHTYFFFSSDHGFELGQFNIIMDKRHVYDWNTRVPLYVKGPGVAAGSTFALPATNVDLAPTFLDLLGVPPHQSMDGRSFAAALRRDTATRAPPMEGKDDGRAAEGSNALAQGWRDSVFVEYYYNDFNTKCVLNCTGRGDYPHGDSWCVNLENNAHCWSPPSAPAGPGRVVCNEGCYTTEDLDNNFIAIRHTEAASMHAGTLFAEFMHGDANYNVMDFAAPNFRELYNASADPWMMDNLVRATPEATLRALHEKLHAWFACSGAECP